MMKLVENKGIQFEEITHSYYCQGKELIGVTSLMGKHGLSADYSGVSQTILDNAAERGKAIHKMLEDYDNGETVLPGDFSKILKAYKELNLNIICSEYLVSDNETVASFIDKVEAVDENTVDLIDVKTTYKLHIEALEWQLGIYKYLFELQNPGIKVRKCWAVHAREDFAKKREINPVSEDRVKELIRCEKEGMIYLEDEPKSVMPQGFDDAKLLQLVTALDELEALNESAKVYAETSKMLMDELYNSMLNENIDEISLPDGRKFTLKRPYSKATFDTKKFKEKYPDLYKQYAGSSITKGNVTLSKK